MNRNASNAVTDKAKLSVQLDERDKRELIGMALRFFANNLNSTALLALGHYGIHDDLTNEEFEELKANTRAALRNLAAEIEA